MVFTFGSGEKLEIADTVYPATLLLRLGDDTGHTTVIPECIIVLFSTLALKFTEYRLVVCAISIDNDSPGSSTTGQPYKSYLRPP